MLAFFSLLTYTNLHCGIQWISFSLPVHPIFKILLGDQKKFILILQLFIAYYLSGRKANTFTNQTRHWSAWDKVRILILKSLILLCKERIAAGEKKCRRRRGRKNGKSQGRSL